MLPWGGLFLRAIEGDFLDNKLALATLTFGMSFDVGVVLSNFVNDATVGSVEVKTLGVAGGANFTNPIFGLFGDAVSALALIVGNININTG